MGGGSYVSITGESPDNLARTITKGGLTTDKVYKFRYRVRNKYGWSASFSPELSVRAATFPSKITSVSFSIVEQTKVRVSWVEPYSGGNAISSYQILFKQNDDLFTVEPTYCNGSLATTVTNKYCDVPFTTLRTGTL